MLSGSMSGSVSRLLNDGAPRPLHRLTRKGPLSRGDGGIERGDIARGIAPGIESDGVTDSITHRIITIYQEPHSGPYIADICHPQPQP